MHSRLRKKQFDGVSCRRFSMIKPSLTKTHSLLLVCCLAYIVQCPTRKDKYHIKRTITNKIHRGSGAVGKRVGHSNGRLGVRIPATTDQSRKKQVVTAPVLNARQKV